MMEEVESSDFILEEEAASTVQSWEPLPWAEGSTCLCFKAKLHGEGAEAAEQKTVFIKQLKEDNRRLRQAFIKEFETGLALRHPHLVDYLELHTEAELPYMVLNYVEGETLRQRLKRDPQYLKSPSTLARLTDQLLDVLGYLHSHQVVHLDIKPDNVMLTRVAGDVKLIDLGFCYSDAFAHSMGHTPRYSAPEQQHGPHAVDARTDLYALGRLLEWVEQDTQSGPLPKAYRRAISWCTQPDPDRRPASAQALRSYLTQAQKAWSWHLWLTLAALAAVALTALLMWCHTQEQQRPQTGDRFVIESEHAGPQHFRITSVQDRTCELTAWPDSTTHYPQNNLFVQQEVTWRGQTYRVTAIGDSALMNLHGSLLQSIEIPTSVNHLGERILQDCNGVTHLTLPASVTTMGAASLAQMRGLVLLRLPKHLKHLPHSCMATNQALRFVQWPDSLLSIGRDAMVDCAFDEIMLPSTVTTIDRGAFYACHHLKRVMLPRDLQTVGDYVFWLCDSLREVFNPQPVPLPISDIFGPKEQNHERTLYVPEQSIKAYRTAPFWCDFGHIEAWNTPAIP